MDTSSHDSILHTLLRVSSYHPLRFNQVSAIEHASLLSIILGSLVDDDADVIETTLLLMLVIDRDLDSTVPVNC